MLTPHAGLQPTTEEEVAAECDDCAVRQSWVIERYEQRRATKIAKGLPDRRYHHLPSGFRVWAEIKRPGGQLTEEQHTWILAELAAGGLALPVEDVSILRALHTKWKALYGQADALAYCREVTALTAKRGYRKT